MLTDGLSGETGRQCLSRRNFDRRAEARTIVEIVGVSRNSFVIWRAEVDIVVLVDPCAEKPTNWIRRKNVQIRDVYSSTTDRAFVSGTSVN